MWTGATGMQTVQAGTENLLVTIVIKMQTVGTADVAAAPRQRVAAAEDKSVWCSAINIL